MKNNIIFEDHFETENGWAFSGEFERNIPSNMHPPYFAYSGYYCLGTDLTGQGSTPYYYENGISPSTAYTATSPLMDISSFSNVSVSFASWLMIRGGDSVRVEVSPDNGSSWITLWKNTSGEILDQDYQFLHFDIDDSLSFSTELRFRFSLFYSSAAGMVAEGWNIDDFVVTGDLVDTGEANLNSPSYDISGLQHPVFAADIWTDTEQGVDGTAVSYSLDDGKSWTDLADVNSFDTYWNWYSGKYVTAFTRDGWSGQSGGWMTVKHLIPDNLIGSRNIQFRFEFKADKFTNDYNGSAVDNIRIYDAPYDVGVTDILSPVTSCELSDKERFRLRLHNYGITGLQPGDTIRIGYYIDKSGFIQSDTEMIVLTENFLPGTSKDFYMNKEFDFGTSGEYFTDVFTMEDDPLFYHPLANDSISRIIRVNKPYVELGPDISTIRPDTVWLSASDGETGNSYLWQDGSTNPDYHVLTEGTYFVKVTNDLACETSDTVNIQQLIADVGVERLLSPVSDCEIGNQIPVRLRIKNFGTDTLNTDDTLYISGMINEVIQSIDTLQFTRKFYPGDSLEFTLSNPQDFNTPGSYRMKLYTRFADDFNHLNDTLSETLEVYGYPDINLGPDTLVEASEYILAPNPGYFSYFWQDGSSGKTFTVDQPGSNSCFVVVRDEHGCSASDSVQVTLNVKNIAIEQILSPAPLCNPSENITLSARVINRGNQVIPVGEDIIVSYSFNGDSTVQEILKLTEDFLPDSTLDFFFSGTKTLQLGQWYDLNVYLDYADDMKTSDDTASIPVAIFDLPVVDLGEDYQVIAGLDHTLDAGPGFVSYLWQDGSTQQTFSINEPGIGSYHVTVTDGNGCTAHDEVEILLAVPDIGINSVVNPVTTCEPENSGRVRVAIKNFGDLDLAASESFTVSYSLNGAAPVSEQVILDAPFKHGSVIYHSFSKVEDITSTGHYELLAGTHYDADLIPSNDTLRVSRDVYDTPVLDIGTGLDTMVVYDPVTLSAGPGFSSCVWQDGSTFADYDIISPGRDLYSVTATTEYGCSVSDSVYVIYDRPDLAMVRIYGPVSNCRFNSRTLVIIEVQNNGYNTIDAAQTINFSYSVNNGPRISENHSLVNGLQPGQILRYYFENPYDFSEKGSYQLDVDLAYSSDGDSSNNSLSSEVINLEIPDVDIGEGEDTLHSSLPLTLDAGPGYTSYVWQDNSTGSLMEADHYGLYYVRVTNAQGCSASDSVFIGYPLSYKDWRSPPEWISVFPNPAEDHLHINMHPEEEKDITLELYNIKNDRILHKELWGAGEIELDINTQDLFPGLYYLKVQADGIIYTFKLIVL